MKSHDIVCVYAFFVTCILCLPVHSASIHPQSVRNFLTQQLSQKEDESVYPSLGDLGHKFKEELNKDTFLRDLTSDHKQELSNNPVRNEDILSNNEYGGARQGADPAYILNYLRELKEMSRIRNALGNVAEKRQPHSGFYPMRGRRSTSQ